MTVEVALGSTLAGFRVERLLGRGAMGAVYLAQDAHLRRKVAIKVLAREFAEDEVLYLAMKYVEGYDLRELIDATEGVGEERALSLLAQVGDALDMAHGL